ncbi:MAG: hypothetical protein M5U34_24145 [Chloroflexi bacterium]|nr:hypothetical protein [Chloroflexota bacterium]
MLTLFVVNEADEVLIVENQVNGRSWGSWRVVGRDLENGERSYSGCAAKPTASNRACL